MGERERGKRSPSSCSRSCSCSCSLRPTSAHWRHADIWRLRDQVLRDLDLHADERLASALASDGVTLDGERFLHADAAANPAGEEESAEAEQPDPE